MLLWSTSSVLDRILHSKLIFFFFPIKTLISLNRSLIPSYTSSDTSKLLIMSASCQNKPKVPDFKGLGLDFEIVAWLRKIKRMKLYT